MAIHWVNGGDVQWEEMYTAELPKLVSLPAYPLNGTDIGCLPQKPHRNRKNRRTAESATRTDSLTI